MKDSEYYLTRILIIFGFLVVGFFGAKIIASIYYDSLVKASSPGLDEFKVNYQNKINQETNPYKLANLGRSLAKAEQKDLALMALAKATELDPKWRDGWLLRGLTDLKLNQPKEALNSFKKAESLDPIYPLTYKLLSIAYQTTGDDVSAKYAREKMEFLNHK